MDHAGELSVNSGDVSRLGRVASDGNAGFLVDGGKAIPAF
jgi:hypothetical protein